HAPARASCDCVSIPRRPPAPPLFPYTTLFRSGGPLNDLINVGGDLTLDGTINVNTSVGGIMDVGVYRVINYAGSLTNNGLSLGTDRKSTRLNSSHVKISYAVFCLKKKRKMHTT